MCGYRPEVQNRCARRSGFTLVELVVVTMILGIIAAIAIPRFATSVHEYRAKMAASRLVEDLNMARRRALILGKTVTVLFDTTNHAYSIPQVQSLNSAASTYQVSLATAPYLARFDSVSFPGGTGGSLQVEFNHYGIVDGGGSAVVRSGSFTKTVVLSSDTGEATAP